MRRLVFLLTFLVECAVAQQSPHGDIKIACQVCHSTDSWSLRSDASFNHNSTGFSLVGQHRFGECRSCHENLVFTKKSSDCTSCHTDVHRQELGTNCLRCHTMQSWIVADMKQKHQETRFPLVGGHALVMCEGCHERASTHRYAGTPLTCITCHKKDFDATTSPNHAASGFPVDCSRCHKVDAVRWDGGFDHNLTGFPLSGAHRAIICSDCHKNNQFTKLSTNCFDCHSSDFTRSQSPDHQTGNFSHDCLSCHTTTAWHPATFDHNATRFPLTGKHISTLCQACHTNGNFQLTYSDCYQCHRTDYQRPTDPNHVSAGFSHNCLGCHSTTTWSGLSFDHSKTTFSLTGKHLTITCQLCHTNGNYQLAYTNCYQCHQTNFQQTTNPNHATESFPHDCAMCHNTSVWTPNTMNHDAAYFKIYSGHHNGRWSRCSQCHTTLGNFAAWTCASGGCHAAAHNQGRNCYGCHRNS